MMDARRFEILIPFLLAILLTAYGSFYSATADSESTPAPVTCPVVKYAASAETAEFKPPSYPAGAKEGHKYVCVVEIAAESDHFIVLRVYPKRDSPKSVRVELYQLVMSDDVDWRSEWMAVKEAV